MLFFGIPFLSHIFGHSAQNNLVLTSAYGMDSSILVPFLESFHRNMPQSTTLVVVVNSDVDSETEGLLKKYHAGIHRDNIDSGFSVLLHRFQTYYHYLLDPAKRQKYANVAFVDIRDVLFQSDPFQTLGPIQGVVFTLEGNVHAPKNIGQCPYNEKWIKTCFGSYFGELAFKPISCAGTTMGDIESMIAYTRTMLQIATLTPATCTGETGGDQAIHNFILHYLNSKKLLSFHAIALNNGDSPTATVGYTDAGELEHDPSRHILKFSDQSYRVPALLHQYDRLPQIKEDLLAYYSLNSRRK